MTIHHSTTECLTDARRKWTVFLLQEYSVPIMGKSASQGISAWKFISWSKCIKKNDSSVIQNETNTADSRKLKENISVLKVDKTFCVTVGWHMETQYKHLKARTSYKNLSFDLLLYFFCRSVLLQTSNSTSDIPFFSNCCSVSSYKYKLE